MKDSLTNIFRFQNLSDNVFVDIDPGENWTYHYQILPGHPAGTYWYHAHLHGSTMFQVCCKESSFFGF